MAASRKSSWWKTNILAGDMTDRSIISLTMHNLLPKPKTRHWRHSSTGCAVDKGLPSFSVLSSVLAVSCGLRPD